MVWNRAHENEVGKATSGRLESKHYQESYLDALLGRKTHIIFSFLINFSEKVHKFLICSARKIRNYTTRETFSCTTEIKEKLQSEVLSLKGNIASLEQKCEKLEKYVFSFDNVKTDYS